MTYVYTLRLIENKNIEASPIQEGQASLNNSDNASNVSISNSTKNVKKKFSLQPIEEENELLKNENRRLKEINRTDALFSEGERESYDIRYSTFGQDSGKVSIDKYTEKQYKDYGWVHINEVLTGNELQRLYSRFDDAKNLEYKYPKTEQGEYMIIVGNDNADADHLVYIKGKTSHPVITKVIALSSAINGYTDIDRKSLLWGYIENGNGVSSAFKSSAGEFSKEEIFIRYTNEDYKSYGEIRTSRKNAGSNKNRGKFGYGRGSFTEDTGDVNKYSLQPVEDENEALRRENSRLREINQALRYEYGYAEEGVPDGRKVRQAAGRIKKSVNSSLSVADISERLTRIFTEMNKGDWSFDSFQQACRDLADELVQTSNNWHEPTAESKALLKEIRAAKIKLSDTQKAEAAYAAGGKFGDFYRSVFGKVSIFYTPLPTLVTEGSC